MEIKVSKKTLEVTFKCKTLQEMKWVLEMFKKGNESTLKDIQNSINSMGEE